VPPNVDVAFRGTFETSLTCVAGNRECEMANERLRRAIQQAGLRLEDVAQHVEIDVKTAERWITKGRLPHARNRAKTAQLLRVDELELWPEVAEERRGHRLSDGELVRVYSHRGAVPHERWYELLEDATQRVDVLVHAGLFLPDGRSDLAALVRRKAEAGLQIRLLYGDPESDAIALRGAEEGIGDGLAARIRLSLVYMREAFEEPNVSVRLHSTTLYNSLYRYDDDLLVNSHAYGVPAGQSPVLHLRRFPGGRLFEHYMASFERVWAAARPLATSPAELVEA
jgi:transcriptional regulator with XRE-family HTH domain